MAGQDPAYLGVFTTDPGVYKYIHLGSAAGTTQIVATGQPALLGYLQLNNCVPGTVVVYDSAGTSASVIGSCAITSTGGSAPIAPLFRKLATKTGLTVSYTGNLDLTVAYLP